MRKILIGFVFLTSLLAATAFAEVSTTGLSEEQILQLKADAARIVAENAKAKSMDDSSTVLDKVLATTEHSSPSTWGQQAAVAAEGIANALGIAAKTVGVSVNDFAATPAGKLVVIGIGIKLFGSLVIKFVVSLLSIIATLLLIRFGVRSMCGVESTVSHPKKLFWGLIEYTKVTHIYRGINDLGDGASAGAWLLIIVGFIVLAIIGCNI
jgi:hypothetical protein